MKLQLTTGPVHERGAPTLHARLRSATQTLHDKLERHLGLMTPHLSLLHYKRIMALFHGFYRPIEAGLEQLSPVAPARTFPLRSRTELLERDLLALGWERQAISALPTCTDLPELRDPEHFVGCLYVLEGASLGGQLLTRHVRATLGLTSDRGAAFFTGDGASTPARWKCVLQWLEHVSHSRLSMEQIVTSAGETFSSLLVWTRAQGLNGEH